MMGISGLILLVFMSSAILLNAAEQEEIPQQNMPGKKLWMLFWSCTENR